MILRLVSRTFGRALPLIAAVLCVVAPQARADAGWFESGDTQLRMDLQLLNDAEIIVLPLNQWPLPRAAVRFAPRGAGPPFAFFAGACARATFFVRLAAMRDLIADRATQAQSVGPCRVQR